MTKLTDDQVRAIFLDPRDGKATSAAFGTTQSNVSAIRRRKIWRRVTAGLEAPARAPRPASRPPDRTVIVALRADLAVALHLAAALAAERDQLAAQVVGLQQQLREVRHRLAPAHFGRRSGHQRPEKRTG